VTAERLDSGVYRELVRRALAEDLGWGDVTTAAIVASTPRARGRLVAGGDIVLAGLDVALEAFRQLDPSLAVHARREDGDRGRAGWVIAELDGLAAPMLTAERTALNLLRHLSGVATLTRQLVDAGGGRLQVGDTRKTMPLLRSLQKYAVRVGGGANGRLSLDDGIIVKRSHARVAGGLGPAIARARAAHPDVPVQAELAALDDADAAIGSGAAVVLLPAALLGDLPALVERCAGRVRIEVTGVRSVADVRAAAAAGADFVSCGCLTDSAPAADVTLELEPA
jgi:nicotinate-nucleotide pyrophosphorylase (carboxylating)